MLVLSKPSLHSLLDLLVNLQHRFQVALVLLSLFYFCMSHTWCDTAAGSLTSGAQQCTVHSPALVTLTDKAAETYDPVVTDIPI